MRKFLLIGSLAMFVMGAAAPLALAQDQDRGGGNGQAAHCVPLARVWSSCTRRSARPSQPGAQLVSASRTRLDERHPQAV